MVSLFSVPRIHSLGNTIFFSIFPRESNVVIRVIMPFSKFSALGFLTFAAHSLCKHVNFAVTLTWGPGSPDGQTRNMIFTNNQFPGPQLLLDYGDDVEVNGAQYLQSGGKRSYL